ncbi:MAG: hypothetical protein E6K80_14055 [Candidatus Eisenbacteria bacterium]|uniref:L,D-TPase catalytic domain-containing protein n=1 Tax=Eiseniibacteriota bacterium TaxID=2212470 RepID=A0A538TYI9_UNCEI|nr:MAG: hypothetical protein E6K80_14055 [Candidatus Eisenbacteria bacterium]
MARPRRRRGEGRPEHARRRARSRELPSRGDPVGAPEALDRAHARERGRARRAPVRRGGAHGGRRPLWARAAVPRESRVEPGPARQRLPARQHAGRDRRGAFGRQGHRRPAPAALHLSRPGGRARAPAEDRGPRRVANRAAGPQALARRRRPAHSDRAPPARDQRGADRARVAARFDALRPAAGTSGQGVIDKATIEAMNVDVGTRIGQVRATMERARWVLGGLGQDFLLVNLPAFKAYLIRGNRNVWESRTQIGEEALQTPTFRATIRTIVFNPDWSVPQSILQNEILAQMRAGKNVVAQQGLVIYDDANHVIDPASIDWAHADSTNFPYSMKQPPSDDNALGKVKFLFPNKYAIYLHDTPNRRLFEADKRTFSHGCIRIEDAVVLAERLLGGQEDWDRAKIDRSIASESTMNVALEHPLPILIVYWPVSVGATGEVRYADDIYHLDPPLVAALDRRR